jgi:hypothetical protein
MLSLIVTFCFLDYNLLILVILLSIHSTKYLIIYIYYKIPIKLKFSNNLFISKVTKYLFCV